MYEFQFLQRSREEFAPAPRPKPLVVHRKLMVGSTRDPAESQADRLADLAMRHLTAGRPAEPSGVAPAGNTRIRRRSVGVGAEGGPVDDATARQLEAARGGGQSLSEPVRARMEGAFGADFSGVRVHDDGNADQLNHQLQSRAFTTGGDIFFRRGEYRPGSGEGDRLLAHELAHTVQQGASGLQRRFDDENTIRRAFAVEGTDWSEAKSIRYTGGGSANGVFFVSSKSESLVVKPSIGAARNQVAAEMMQASGAHAVGMRTISLESPEGKQLIKVMKSLASKAKKGSKKGAQDTITPAVNRLTSGEYDSVTVMPAYQNLSNMQELVSGGNFGDTFKLMLKNGFFAGLGRIHAADLMMGNEDRLGRLGNPSLKNVFVNTWSGQAVGLDLDFNATSFEQVTGDISDPNSKQTTASTAPSLENHQYKDFVAYSIEGGTAKKDVKDKKTGNIKSGGMGMRGGKQFTSDLSGAVDTSKVGTIFDDFKNAVIDELRVQKNDTDKAILEQLDWSGPKAQFMTGVNDGLAALRKKMGDLTARAGQLKTQHGDDNFLDPRVLKIRNMYVVVRKHFDEVQTRRLLEEYAKILVNGGTDDDFFALLAQLHQAFQARSKPQQAQQQDHQKPQQQTGPKAPTGGMRWRGAKPRTLVGQ